MRVVAGVGYRARLRSFVTLTWDIFRSSFPVMIFAEVP